MPIVSAVGIAVGNNLGGSPELADKLQTKLEEVIRLCQARGDSEDVMQEMIRQAREQFSQDIE